MMQALNDACRPANYAFGDMVSAAQGVESDAIVLSGTLPMTPTPFDQLLGAARQEREPQRLPASNGVHP